MYIALSILAELLFVSLLIILFYRLKSRFGLVPLYILLGANQYFQTILASSFYIKLFGELSISPGSIILFSSSLFAILFIYIKEGVRSTQILIMGIVLANLSVTLLATITNLQETVMQDIIYSSGTAPHFFNTNFWIFFVGTITLILDAIILVILYEFLFTKVRRLNLFTCLLITMLVVFNFDAIVFSLGSFWGNADLENKIVSQLVSKSAVAVFFAAVLWLYLRYLDNDRKNYDESTVKKSNEDIFSILTYKGKFEKLQLEKRISDEQLQKSITDKTEELKNSVRRFTILSSVQELRVDKFSSAEQANEFLIKVKEAFETDVCTIHLLKKENLELLSAIGLESHEEETLLDSTIPFFSEIIQQKKYLAIEDTDKDQGIIKGRKQGVIKFNYKSCLGAPLLSGNKVIGILKIYSRTVKRIFTTIEIEHFQSVALQIARTIENAQLYEQNEKHKEVLVKQIVARKKAIEETLKSIQRFELIGKASNDAVWEWNLETNEFWGNEIHMNMYGLTKADPEPGDDEWKRRLHDEDRERMIQTNDDALASDVNSFEAEYRLYTENKGWIHIYGRNYIERNEAGKAIRMLGSMMDITERKKAEEEIQKLATIVQRSPEFIGIAGLDAKAIYLNEGGKNMVGLERDITTSSMWDLFAPPDLEIFQTTAIPTIQREGRWVGDINLKNFQTGETIPVWMDIFYIYHPQTSEPIAFATVTSDNKERKKAEDALKESEEKFRALVENNDSIIGMFDEHLNPIYRSPSTYRILGWTMEEKANDTQLNHVHPDDSELFKNTLKEVMANPGKAVKRSVRLKHKNGNWVMLEGTITNLLHNSSVRAIVSNIQDITERKKAEQAVKESEEKFRTLVQQAGDGIVIVDHGGNYLEANESMSKLTGYSISELTKMNARQIVEAEDLQKNPLKLEEIKTGNPVFLERVIVKKDGILRDVEISAKLMHNGKVICIMRDVTNRKQAEAAFKQAHERLVFHLDNSPLGYIEWDKNLFVRTWSKRTEEIFGWLEKEFIEKQLNGFNLVHEDDVAELTVIAQQLMEGTLERNHVIHRNYTKSGKIIWCEWFNSVLKDKEGNVITIMSLVQDITERKEIEVALSESENYLRTILDTEPECVKVLNSKGELLSMNPAGLAMIEADSEQQVVGHRMTEMVDEKYRIGFNRLSKEVFNGHSGTFEFQITGLKGGHRWLETHAVPLKDSAGKITNLLGVTRNITERKKAEEEITNTTEQLRQLTAHLQNIREDERKRIAREIHDDLGQQLTAIKMDTVWIDKQIPAETSAVKDKLQNILELLDGSHQSVRKILNELRPAVLDDNGLLEALQWQGQQFTESTGTPVHFASNQSSLKVPQETATCIFRVYQESLTNIMRYAGAGKVVSSLNIISDSIILAIEDDGKGFDVEAVQNKKSFGLLGMKERVHSLNGKIDLISSPGKGTKIVISLPYKKT